MANSFSVFAIDPGNQESAYVRWNGEKIVTRGKTANTDLLKMLRGGLIGSPPLYIEMIASYGMAVGREVFETCVWIGRFEEAYDGAYEVYRKDVKLHLCNSVKAKDSNIRQALIDRFGPPGKKASPGITYGLKADEWQAFALAVYAFDELEAGR